MEHTVTIIWGKVFSTKETYRFDTRAELNAFMEGVEATIGWQGYEVLRDSRDEQDPNEPLIFGESQ